MTRIASKLAPAATGSLSLMLRLASLAGKLALSLYMGKYFELAELGIYGLAFGAVMLAIVFFGMRVDYVVARDILGQSPERQRQIGTGVAALYFGSFLAAAPAAGALLVLMDDSGNSRLLAFIYLLCGVEAYANFLYTTTIALKRPALANALFFIRSGAWTIPAMALSYADPALRTAEFVIAWWLAGATLSVAANLWTMRSQLIAWPARWAIDLAALREQCRGAFLIWVGSLAVTLGAYADRFILAAWLSLEDVGVATFYISFTTAALTLVQSATTSITFPTLIEHFDSGRFEEFRRELRRTARTAALLAILILAGLTAMIPLTGSLLGKSELADAWPAFAVLAIATLVRTHAETLYYGLFVQRRHRAIWLGNLLFLACSLALNLLLIPLAGLIGLALAALASAMFIALWRAAALRSPATGGERAEFDDSELAWREASESQDS